MDRQYQDPFFFFFQGDIFMTVIQMISARTVMQYVATDGLARETRIMARALEEVTTTAMTTAVWRAGSVFI
jgi:hypothetical protein